MASYNAGFGNIEKAQRLASNPSEYHRIIALLPKVTGKANALETQTYVQQIFRYFFMQVLEG